MNTKKFTSNILLSIATIIACAFLFAKPELCAGGIKDGLILCASTVIPSLFPFMIVSQFIVKSGLSAFIGKVFEKPTCFIFGLPGVTAGVIFMSLIGGYPIGAKMTADLLERGVITENQAQRLNLFCINAGPAFIIGTVGTMFLSSRRAGVILYFSCVSASLITGIMSRVLSDGNNRCNESPCFIIAESPVTAFTSSTVQSAKAMIAISAWVVIFNSVTRCIMSFGSGSAIIALCGIMEVTNGVKLSLGTVPIAAIAAILSFGGLSVHCQIYSSVVKSGLKIRHFYTARLICSAIAAFICMWLMKIFPCEISVFSNVSSVTPSAYCVSLPAAAALLVMCAVLIFEVDTDRKIC